LQSITTLSSLLGNFVTSWYKDMYTKHTKIKHKSSISNIIAKENKE